MLNEFLFFKMFLKHLFWKMFFSDKEETQKNAYFNFRAIIFGLTLFQLGGGPRDPPSHDVLNSKSIVKFFN